MIRGWCPTLYEPMPTGDGLLVRVKPPGSRLSAQQARDVAGAAETFGNGIVELTGRGNLQVRGLRTDTVPAFAAAMVDAGLASADAAAERRRNIVVSPLAGDDPTAAFATAELATTLEAKLAATGSLGGLPSKFCVAVDGGGRLPLAFQADVTIYLDPAGAHANLAGRVEATCPRDRLVDTVMILLRESGERRMLQTIRQIGGRALLASVGLETRTARLRRPVRAVGFHRYGGGSRGAIGFGVPFGQASAVVLRGLAGIAEAFSDGTLRMSPWRTVLLGSIHEGAIGRARDAAREHGLIFDPADPRLRVFACVGSPGCASGARPARADAARFAPSGFRGTLHVSGCAKGCGHPATATATLVGTGGGYRLVRNGRASDVASQTRLSITEALAALRDAA